jgi:hypothetical protein
VSLSRDPVVWRGAGAGLLNLAVSVGVLTRPAADQIDGGLGALLVAVVALAPVLGAILARFRTAAVAKGTPAGTPALVLGGNGVYRAASRSLADDITRADTDARRDDLGL